MAERFLPVDLDTPGLRIMHFDPPVFTLPGFFTGKPAAGGIGSAGLELPVWSCGSVPVGGQRACVWYPAKSVSRPPGD